MSDQMRMLGLNSGLDTESIVSELVKAQSSKKTKIENDKTKLTWRQEIWKDLNTKVKTFFNKTLDNMRWTSSYKKKKTTVGDSKIASIVSSDSAVNGTQTMAVKQLAKSGYLTGGKLSDNGSVGEGTTLAQLTKGKIANDAEIEFSMKVGDNEKTIKLNGTSTIGDIVKEFKDAGVNANFDKENQRLFLAASASGKKNDFTLTANNEDSLLALAGAGLLSAGDAQKNSKYAELAKYYDTDDATTKDSEDFKDYAKSIAKDEAKKLISGLGNTQDSITSSINDRNYGAAKASMEELKTTVLKLKKYAETGEIGGDDLDKLNAAYDFINANTASTEISITSAEVATQSDTILSDAMNTAFDKVKTAYTALSGLEEITNGKLAERVVGQDAVIMLNGVDYESATNSVSVNGLTITAQSESEYTEYTNEQGEKIRKYVETSVNTQDDIDGIYDMIKSFFKEYNDLIKEMDTRYNADRAKGYEPLTDEQKDAMSEDEVEKWETKIKDSLLRKDTSLNSALSALKNNMLGSFVIDGKKYSLSSFGIETLSYFIAADNEHGIYHIDGDSDDETTGTRPDKLKAMISTNPEVVMNFFTQLANGIHNSLDKLMTKTDYRSRYSIYDDKAMKDELLSFDEKIKKQEEYISNLEDRYYDQFTAMEKAMADVNSKQSALSGLMGY